MLTWRFENGVRWQLLLKPANRTISFQRGHVTGSFQEDGSVVFRGVSMTPKGTKELFIDFDTLDDAKAWVQKRQEKWIDEAIESC